MIKEKITSVLTDAVQSTLTDSGFDGVFDVVSKLVLTPAKQAEHGDFATNIALILAKPLKRSPREIAEAICQRVRIDADLIEKTEIAGPGFINFFVTDSAWQGALKTIAANVDAHLRTDLGQGQRVNIEYVSANPTGPLHIAHGRGAVVGDLIARLMSWCGYDVVREYYVNDLGNQVDIMARSIYLRYIELFGQSFEAPEDFYPGEYIIDIAKQIQAEHGDSLLEKPETEWLQTVRSEGVRLMLQRIKEDLAAFGIHFDNFVSERALADAVGLEDMMRDLQEQGHIYSEEDKLWFKTSAYGDEKDRVVTRADGRFTYFASDIAYHRDKLSRSDHLINIWGADHGGYINRVSAGLQALGHDASALEVILIQMVSLNRGGEAVRMGKRLGNAIWLRDVIEEAGTDATRFFFAMRKADAQMDFDIRLATQKSLDNPVYYAQMGHARLASIGRKALEAGVSETKIANADLSALVLPEEIDLIKKMLRAPEVLSAAAQDRSPHYVVHYVQELIASFHSYYSRYKDKERVLSDDPVKTHARLLLCGTLQIILKTVLVDILGVSAPDAMYITDE